MLDGHIRLAALRELGRREVPCLVATDDEAYTYNNRINRLSTNTSKVDVLRRPIESTQYTSEHFQELLKEQGIACSMSRAGEVWDNSAMESFFSSLKTERTARKVYRSREQARADVFDYIERFYNPTRRHSTLGYVSPIEFEKALKA